MEGARQRTKTMSEHKYGIDLTCGDCGWFLHVRGWRQFVLLVIGLFACYVLGALN